MIPKLTAIACIVAANLLTGTATAGRVHFAGLPPQGVKPSAPITGTLVVSLRPTADTTWNVYADGRVIWQRWTSSGDATVIPHGAKRLDTAYVQRRLTPGGVQLLRSKVFATGLFDHNLNLLIPGDSRAWILDRVRVGTRTVTVSGVGSNLGGNAGQLTRATPTQQSALRWLRKLVTDPIKRLSPGAWADKTIRAFVPSRYVAAFDRSSPDLAKLPALARKAYSRYYLGHGCLLTTAHTRALLQAFLRAGISPSEDHAYTIAFDLVGSAKNPMGGRIPSDFHFSPALPDDHC